METTEGILLFKSIKVESTLENGITISSFVDECLNSCNVSRKKIAQINIALDELYSNICKYAYPPKTGDVQVDVYIKGNPKTLYVVLSDCGYKFNPLENNRRVDINASADERDIGGLGLFIVFQTMDDISYEYKDNKNVLTISKKLED